MNDALIEKLETLLNEEKWTRATINNYTIKNFETVNELITEFKEQEMYHEIEEITNEYLKHNKNSIVALYISSRLQLEDESITNNNLYTLIKIFIDNIKWNIVEYLCQETLEFVEDKFILKTLITAFNNSNRKEELPPLWERLIKVDYEEADAVVYLADLKEENGEHEESLSLLKKAINRYIITKNYVQVEELWKRLLNFEEIGFDFFVNLDKKISKVFTVDRSIELLKLLYQQTIAKDEYDTSLNVLKLVLDKSPTDDYARKEIVTVYRKKFDSHSHLEKYIKISNIEGSWRNIHEAINSFEKHIAFDKNNFVYHRTWGIGRITDISKDVFTIHFQTKKSHKMTLKMALNSLINLPKNHIWILKLKNKELLKKKVVEDIPWTLKTIIQSNNNKASLKTFKEELVPDILTDSKWNSWWTNARKVLKTDPKFGNPENSTTIFEVRDKPLSFEEKTYNSFKASKDFNQRFNLIIDYIDNTDPDPDYLEDMVSYFMTFLNSLYNVNEQTIISYLLVANITKRFNFIQVNIPYSFLEFFNELEDKVMIYQKLLTTEFKKEYLVFIKRYYREWIDIYVRVFYLYPNKFIFDELSKKDFTIIETITKDIIVRYKEYTEAFFWLVGNIFTEAFEAKLSINVDNILFSVIHLIEIATKNISIKKDLIKNKRQVKQLKEYLTKDDLLIKHIEKADKEFSKRLFTIIDELISLDGDYVMKVKNIITDLYSDIDTDKSLKFDVSKTKDNIFDKLLTTPDSYKRMQEEMFKIKDVEIPANSKEIGWAMEKGDLRENAEYKAAKEQQVFLQNKLNKLINDLSKATVIAQKDIGGNAVTFGTHLTLEDKTNDKTVEYTILGPWESQTEKNIISYQSPLGANLLDKKINDEAKFIINDRQYHYIIKDITIATF